MQRHSHPYKLAYTSHFKRAIKKFSKKYPELVKRVEKAIPELSLDPYRKSESLKGELRGKRKMRVGDCRVIFSICEECRKLGYTRINRCIDCESQTDDTIKFFNIELRPRAY